MAIGAAILAAMIYIYPSQNLTGSNTIFQNYVLYISNGTAILNTTSFVSQHILQANGENETTNMNATISTNGYKSLPFVVQANITRQMNGTINSVGTTLHNDRKLEPTTKDGTNFSDIQSRRKTFQLRMSSISSLLKNRTKRIIGGNDVTSDTQFPYFSFPLIGGW